MRFSRRFLELAMQTYLALFWLAAAPSLDWPQWGGSSRNFKSDATGLANS
jgi:hypothetical protein